MSTTLRNAPSVLAITSEMPWPLDSGGHLRTYHVLRALATRCRVRLVVPSATPDEPARLALARAGITPRVVAVAGRTMAAEAMKAARAALQREPYVFFARHRYPLVSDVVREEIRQSPPDLVYMDHLDSIVYANALPDAPIVVDMHNVYSRVASRTADEAGRAMTRPYLRHEAALIARMEQRAADIASALLVVSDEEADYFSALGARHVVVVPNGVDCDTFTYRAPAARIGPPTILYVGSLSWLPNVTAARFLAEHVLPRVRERLPDAQLVIAGKRPSADVLALHRAGAITVAADVPDVTPYFRDAHVLAVPLVAGGGTRLKILEAFSAGLPVVSTAVGCEGLRVEDGRHLVIAGRDVFADAVVTLLADRARADRLAAEARRIAEAHYDWRIVGARARDAVIDVASRAPSIAPQATIAIGR